VDPFAVLAKYGADATRWYLVTASPPWRSTSFDEEGLADTQRKFFGTLVNTYAFFAMYANIDRFGYGEKRIPVAERAEIDRWVISELHSLVARYRAAMDAYDVTKAARSVSEFTIDQLSNWYVRRNRRRFWKSEMGKDKLAAYQTLYECLDTVVRLMAPFAPFLAEELYRNLNTVTGRDGAPSVHLAMIPEPEAREIDRALEERMERAERIVMLVRAMRMKANLKVRQPLPRIILPIAGEREREDVRAMEDVIREEINVKAVEYVSDTSGIVTRRAKANFKSIGPKFGKSVQRVAQGIRDLQEGQIASLEREGSLAIPLDGGSVTVVREDVEIVRDDIKGWLVESDGALTVALDTQVTPALLAEGIAREFVNRVQNMRKDAGFAVTDRIEISFRAGAATSAVLASMAPYITGETLADALSAEFREGEHTAAFEVNGEEITVSIARRGHR